MILLKKVLYLLNMKILIQRVLSSSLTIDGKLINEINKGYMILVSFTIDDDVEIAEKMAKKLVNLRIFEDQDGKTNLSIKDVDGEILSISQFTLYANAKKGNRPSFIEALSGDKAIILYEEFNKILVNEGMKVKTGVFGADMKVSLINDGPFTIMLDSKELF